MNSLNPYESRPRNPYYDNFAAHPVIKNIAKNPRWTTNIKGKTPLSILSFLNVINNRPNCILTGAFQPAPPHTTTLEELVKLIPPANTYVYHLSAAMDGICVIDIEPKCPDDEKERLLRMPALYREVSMSGRGVHLIMPYPAEILSRYPHAAKKERLQHKQKWYEIMFNHYITFTGIMLPEPDQYDNTLFDTLIESLSKEQKHTERADIAVDELKTCDAPYIEDIKHYMLQDLTKQLKGKTCDDFEGDKSRYEYAVMCHLTRAAQNITNAATIAKEHKYTDAEILYLMTHVAKEYLPHRAKHDETRVLNGHTYSWLGFVAASAMKNVREDQAAKKARNAEKRRQARQTKRNANNV